MGEVHHMPRVPKNDDYPVVEKELLRRARDAIKNLNAALGRGDATALHQDVVDDLERVIG